MSQTARTWNSSCTDDNCFEGNLHGDGYHIDGLNNSLFYNLCGNVYNLGVTGSFKSAGIADKDDATKDKAYMENCWINTSATNGFTGKAILGTPAASERKKVVNCYYPQTKAYTASDATPMPESAFYNGTVAYDLNGFYLYKRYNNTKTGTGTAHTFYSINADGTLSAPQTKNYVEQNATYCSSGITDAYDYGGYVEDRYADGDYRYADGTIPENNDQRMWTDTNDKTYFYPIWPERPAPTSGGAVAHRQEQWSPVDDRREQPCISCTGLLSVEHDGCGSLQPGCQPRGILETGQPVR